MAEFDTQERRDTSTFVFVGVAPRPDVVLEATGGYPIDTNSAVASAAESNTAAATSTETTLSANDPSEHDNTGLRSQANTDAGMSTPNAQRPVPGAESTDPLAASRPIAPVMAKMFGGNVVSLVGSTYASKRALPEYRPLVLARDTDPTLHADGGGHTMGELYQRLHDTGNILEHILPLDATRMYLATVYREVQASLPPEIILPSEVFDPGVLRKEFDVDAEGLISVDGPTREVVKTSADDIVAGNPVGGDGSFVALFTPKNIGGNANLLPEPAIAPKPQRQSRRSLSRERKSTVTVTNQLSITNGLATANSGPNNPTAPAVERIGGEYAIARVGIPHFPIHFLIGVEPVSKEVPPSAQDQHGVLNHVTVVGITDRGVAIVKDVLGRHSLDK